MHDPEFLVNLWLTLKPYIQKKEALEAAVSMLRTAEEFGDVVSIRADMRGQDNTLDSALNELYEYSESDSESEDDESFESDALDYDDYDDEE
jgi:hypothetical protein